MNKSITDIMVEQIGMIQTWNYNLSKVEEEETEKNEHFWDLMFDFGSQFDYCCLS